MSPMQAVASIVRIVTGAKRPPPQERRWRRRDDRPTREEQRIDAYLYRHGG